MNVTVRCGLVGVDLFALLPPDMEDINGVVSVELDAIVVLELTTQQRRGDWVGWDCALNTEGYHKSNGIIMALP